MSGSLEGESLRVSPSNLDTYFGDNYSTLDMPRPNGEEGEGLIVPHAPHHMMAFHRADSPSVKDKADCPVLASCLCVPYTQFLPILPVLPCSHLEIATRQTRTVDWLSMEPCSRRTRHGMHRLSCKASHNESLTQLDHEFKTIKCQALTGGRLFRNCVVSDQLYMSARLPTDGPSRLVLTLPRP